MPNVVLGFVVGYNASYIEQLSEECLIDVIYELFFNCFPKLNLPKPVKIIRSKWNEEKFTLGSYTYIKTGSTIQDVKAIVEPMVKLIELRFILICIIFISLILRFNILQLLKE